MSMNTYFWKVDMHPDIDAQTAGEELERINQLYGKLSPGDVVTESRPTNAPLHNVFTWNDSEAASRWREDQARRLIGAIRVQVQIPERKAPVEVRAFVRTAKKSYAPFKVAVQNPDVVDSLLRETRKSAICFQEKHKTYVEAIGTVTAIDKALMTALDDFLALELDAAPGNQKPE